MGKGKTNGIMFNLVEMWIKIPCQNVELTVSKDLEPCIYAAPNSNNFTTKTLR